jgi:prepilin-type processing-associated H-X9-DG protein
LVIAAIILLLAVALPLTVNQKRNARKIQCSNNLKQIGIAFRTWAFDKYPMQMEARDGGSLEAVATGEVFRHFQAMSNELGTPKILVCPADIRVPTKDFVAAWSNTNISYFVGVDARDIYPQMLLSGDRNLTNGPLLPNRLLVLMTNSTPSWTREFHDQVGNVAMADGSVQGFSTVGLRTALQNTGAATNRFAIP